MSITEYRRALFLDRDGVINEDTGYVSSISQFRFIPGIFDLIHFANKKGYLVIIVTNQSGIERGFFSEEDFTLLMNWLIETCKKQNAIIDAYYYSSRISNESKSKSLMRKPHPEMLNKAIMDFNIDPSGSVLVGNELSDMEAAANAAIHTRVLFSRNRKDQENYFPTVSSLLEITRFFN
jgi:D-glycero-D-manno-heptose 1,7-bisphosphate phosphatase